MHKLIGVKSRTYKKTRRTWSIIQIFKYFATENGHDLAKEKKV